MAFSLYLLDIPGVSTYHDNSVYTSRISVNKLNVILGESSKEAANNKNHLNISSIYSSKISKVRKIKSKSSKFITI